MGGRTAVIQSSGGKSSTNWELCVGCLFHAKQSLVHGQPLMLDAQRQWGLSKRLFHGSAHGKPCPDGSTCGFVIIFPGSFCHYPKPGEKHLSRAACKHALPGVYRTSTAAQAWQDALVPSKANRPETCDMTASSHPAGDCFMNGSWSVSTRITELALGFQFPVYSESEQHLPLQEFKVNI